MRARILERARNQAESYGKEAYDYCCFWMQAKSEKFHARLRIIKNEDTTLNFRAFISKTNFDFRIGNSENQILAHLYSDLPYSLY